MFEILILFSILGVISVLFQIFRERKHLTDQQLNKLMQNRLSPSEKGTVIAHLGICSKCQERLEKKNFGDDIEEHLVE